MIDKTPDSPETLSKPNVALPVELSPGQSMEAFSKNPGALFGSDSVVVAGGVDLPHGSLEVSALIDVKGTDGKSLPNRFAVLRNLDPSDKYPQVTVLAPVYVFEGENEKVVSVIGGNIFPRDARQGSAIDVDATYSSAINSLNGAAASSTAFRVETSVQSGMGGFKVTNKGSGTLDMVFAPQSPSFTGEHWEAPVPAGETPMITEVPKFEMPGQAEYDVANAEFNRITGELADTENEMRSKHEILFQWDKHLTSEIQRINATIAQINSNIQNRLITGPDALNDADYRKKTYENERKELEQQRISIRNRDDDYRALAASRRILKGQLANAKKRLDSAVANLSR